jgi:hypothetical protein
MFRQVDGVNADEGHHWYATTRSPADWHHAVIIGRISVSTSALGSSCPTVLRQPNEYTLPGLVEKHGVSVVPKWSSSSRFLSCVRTDRVDGGLATGSLGRIDGAVLPHGNT